MVRGRKSKPTALKVAEGNPGHRPLSKIDLTSSPSVPKCPTWLDAAARAVWKEQVFELHRLGMLRTVDQVVLANLCDSVAMLRSAKRKMAKLRAEMKKKGADPDDALLYKTAGGSIIQSPLVGIINREKLNIQRMASEFGMTPASRARLMFDDGGGGNDPDQEYESALDAPRDGYDDDELTIN